MLRLFPTVPLCSFLFCFGGFLCICRIVAVGGEVLRLRGLLGTIGVTKRDNVGRGKKKKEKRKGTFN